MRVLVNIATSSAILLLVVAPQAKLLAQERPPQIDLNGLRDKSPLSRIEAILDIRRNRLGGPPTAETLIDLILGEKDTYVREVALETLYPIAADARPSASRLLQLMENSTSDPNLRARAAQVIGTIAGNAPESIPHLVKVSSDHTQPEVLREATLEALQNFGRLPSEYVAPISGIAFNAREPNLSIRGSAIVLLANAGREAISTIQQLTNLLEKQSQPLGLRQRAAYALGAIGGDAQFSSPVAILTDLLASRSEKLPLRREIAHALQSMGKTAVGALPELARLLELSDTPLLLRLDAVAAI